MCTKYDINNKASKLTNINNFLISIYFIVEEKKGKGENKEKE